MAFDLDRIFAQMQYSISLNGKHVFTTEWQDKRDSQETERVLCLMYKVESGYKIQKRTRDASFQSIDITMSADEEMDEWVEFAMSEKSEFLLGLDDPQMVKEAFPSFRRISKSKVTASVDDAKKIMKDASERALVGGLGYHHTASERKAMQRVQANIVEALRLAEAL